MYTIRKKKKICKTGREPTWKSSNAFTPKFSTILKRLFKDKEIRNSYHDKIAYTAILHVSP